MRSTTETLIAAMRILARDIQSGDGVANAAISEAAGRLEEQQAALSELEAKVKAQHLDWREVEKLLNAVHTVRKAVEVQSGRKMGENETFEDFVITHLGGVQLKAEVAKASNAKDVE